MHWERLKNSRVKGMACWANNYQHTQKPTQIAIQLAVLSFSFSHQEDKTAIRIGTENWIAPVSANCRYCRATKLRAVITTSIRPRNICSLMFTNRKRLQPILGANIKEVMSTWVKKRIHTTWRTGKVTTNHLAQVSKLANIRVVSVTSAIPIFRFLELSLRSCVMRIKVSDLSTLYR